MCWLKLGFFLKGSFIVNFIFMYEELEFDVFGRLNGVLIDSNDFKISD